MWWWDVKIITQSSNDLLRREQFSCHVFFSVYLNYARIDFKVHTLTFDRKSLSSCCRLKIQLPSPGRILSESMIGNVQLSGTWIVHSTIKQWKLRFVVANEDQEWAVNNERITWPDTINKRYCYCSTFRALFVHIQCHVGDDLIHMHRLVLSLRLLSLLLFQYLLLLLLRWPLLLHLILLLLL